MNLYTLLKKPFFSRYQKPWSWPAEAEAERGSWRRVDLDNGRGGTLVGLFGESSSGPARATVVCAHPMGVEAKGFYLKHGHARMLRESGFNVLLFDFNGFGESPDADLLYPADVLAAAKGAAALAPGLPVMGLGASFGAAWLVCALGQQGHGMTAAVMECPFTTLDEYWVRYKVAFAVLKASNVLMPRLLAKLRPVARVRDVADVKAVLFIYGGQDSVTPSSMGERLLAACPLPREQCSMWVIPEAKHTRALTAAPQAYRERVVGLFESALAQAAPRAQQARG
ncbi:alpha/beta hydrolase [Pyxidicoccus xibeiensis]|uniref:alpha/beta hydrolase n=1 Tax=Pyxidicoccus xibeiensis TaxID=2906759 RepID=UPI0020A73FA7|nr:alpha/beta hydrolase [Pyxidicoccus xibeiensis]MCP3136812.1 lysophospholipase [Pyxidicoccus xibeiensis]